MRNSLLHLSTNYLHNWRKGNISGKTTETGNPSSCLKLPIKSKLTNTFLIETILKLKYYIKWNHKLKVFWGEMQMRKIINTKLLFFPNTLPQCCCLSLIAEGKADMVLVHSFPLSSFVSYLVNI